MTNPPSTSKPGRRKTLAALLIVAGVAVIATSFVWPGKSSQRGAWSTEQAKQYQAAANKLHSLQHEIAHAKPDREASVREDLEKATAEYNALRGDLDAAMSRPQRWAWIMRLGGILAVSIGGMLLFTLPNAES